MLTIRSHLDVTNGLGRTTANPTGSWTLMTLVTGPGYPAVLSRQLGLTRSKVSNHLGCLRDCGIVVAESEGHRTGYELADLRVTRARTALLNTPLAVDHGAECMDPCCAVPEGSIEETSA